MNDNYGELNKRYYGDEMEDDPEIHMEWSRIPHFYYNYYVFQYATGFSAASALAQKVLTKDPAALDRYLTYLKSGDSDYPIEVMKKAGVDMTKPDYIEDAMHVFEERLNELELLVDELEK
ncbi:oligoendopeptidase F [Tetragenococcus muriaticus 3MR10-3]|uniref:Oligoendopeptidase F n=1 Tax=Tetragenococcus muriaticus 3MR10-3 TaxID=1302648 RepID=A0A091CDI2_9ENTE|nr:oligoendopeptidase F [Tetragenococcus muriaticus 3MR10-3]